MQNKQLETVIFVLREISTAVVHQRNINALLDKVLDILHRQMGMLRATFTLRQGDIFDIEASHGLDESEIKRGRYQLGEGITGFVAQSAIPQLVPDISKDKRFLKSYKVTCSRVTCSLSMCPSDSFRASRWHPKY